MRVTSIFDLDFSTLPDVTASERSKSRNSIELSGLSDADAIAVRAWAVDRGYTIDGVTPRIAAFLLPADTDRPLASIDYKRGLRVRLQPVTVLKDGHIDRVLYFDPSDVTMSPQGFALAPSALPVLREDRTYVDGILGPALRSMTITWYATDGSPYATKEVLKSYSPAPSVAAHAAVALQSGESLLDEGIPAGEQRRSNVFAQCATYAYIGAATFAGGGGALPAGDVEGEVQAFSARHRDAINDFIESASYDIGTAIAADAVTVWLDTAIAPGVTARQAMLAALAPWAP